MARRRSMRRNTHLPKSAYLSDTKIGEALRMALTGWAIEVVVDELGYDTEPEVTFYVDPESGDFGIEVEWEDTRLLFQAEGPVGALEQFEEWAQGDGEDED